MGQEDLQPDHHQIPVDVGDYRHTHDPDDDLDEPERPEAMDAALLMFRALTVITALSALTCMIVNLVSLLRSFRWKVEVSAGHVLSVSSFRFVISLSFSSMHLLHSVRVHASDFLNWKTVRCEKLYLRQGVDCLQVESLQR